MKIKLIALALAAASLVGVSCQHDPDVILIRPHTHTYSKPPPTSLQRDVQRASEFQAVRSWDSNN